jgi:hypothetical protein
MQLKVAEQLFAFSVMLELDNIEEFFMLIMMHVHHCMYANEFLSRHDNLLMPRSGNFSSGSSQQAILGCVTRRFFSCSTALGAVPFAGVSCHSLFVRQRTLCFLGRSFYFNTDGIGYQRF